MKLLFRTKLIGFLALGLITIVTTSACSIAVPEFLHISNVYLTDDENKIQIKITDSQYNNWNLLYDITENQVQSTGSEQIILDIELRPSIQNYITILHESEGLTRWQLKDNESNLIFDIELLINASEGVNSPYGFHYFVSEKLNTAYLIIPNYVNDSTIPHYYEDYATIVIVPIDNLENIIYKTDVEWYNDLNSFSTSNELYDEFQLYRLHGNGADCVNSVYFKFYPDNFELLIKSVAGQSEVLDPRSGKLIIASYQWTAHTSTIEVVDLLGFGSRKIIINPEDIQNLIENNPESYSKLTETLSESITVPVLSLLSTSIGLFIIMLLRSKN